MTDILARTREAEKRKAQVAVNRAILINEPEKRAAAQRYGQQLGLPADIVAEAFPQAEERVRQEQAAATLQTAPGVARWASDPANAEVAIDQIPALALMERAAAAIFPGFKAARALGRTTIPRDYGGAYAGGTVSSLGMGVGGLGELGMGFTRTVRRTLGMNATPGERPGAGIIGQEGGGSEGRRGGDVAGLIWDTIRNLPRSFAGAEDIGERVEAAGRSLEPENPTLGTQVAGALGQITGQAAVTVASPVAGLALMAGQGAEDMADRAAEAGVAGTPEGDVAMLANSATNMALERAGLNRLLKALPNPVQGRVFAKVRDVAEAAGVEGATEFAQEIASNVIERALVDPEAPILEGATEAGVVGGAAGGIFRALLMAAVPGRSIRGRSEAAGEAQDAGTPLDMLVEAVRSSPMPERAPERFRELLEGLSDGAEVFVPAETLRTYLQGKRVDEQDQFLDIGSIREQLASATPEADIVIPAADYFARIATVEGAHEALARDLRLGIDAMSLSEAEAFNEEKETLLRDEGERLLARAREEEAQAAPGERVYQDTFRQLREAGYTLDAAKRYAALWQSRYETRGARLGVDAYEAMQRNRPEIRAAVPEELRRRVDRLDVMVTALRDGRKLRTGEGPSLLDFLSKQGGLRDDGGELTNLDAQTWHQGKPGKRKLVNPEGRTLEQAAQAAYEAGFFPEKADAENPVGPDELLSEIEAELRGQRTRRAVPLSEQRSDFARAVEQLDELLNRMGINPDEATDAEIREAVEAYSRDPEGATFEQMAGVGAIGAPVDALRRAEEMEAERDEEGFKTHGRDEIWEETGWIRGDDGKWRFEISDDGAVLRENWEQPLSLAAREGRRVPLREVFDHPDLYAAYPAAGDIAVDRADLSSFGKGVMGMFGRTKAGRPIIYLHEGTTDEKQIRLFLLHEIQHFIQEQEGFAQGASSSSDKLRKMGYDIALAEKIAEMASFDGDETAKEIVAARLVYERSAGEIEARNTGEWRANMTAEERRASSPERTRDTPRSQAIVVFKGVEGYQAARTFFQPAYHGSPHIFDRFSTAAIGTGEGAQAYGWGLYFAGRREIAEFYRDKLAEDTYTRADGSVWSPDSLRHLNVRVAARKNGVDLDATLERARSLLETADQYATSVGVRAMLEADIAELEALKESGGLTAKRGRLYEVEIPEDDEYLLWDKPLSEQPEKVRGAVAKIPEGVWDWIADQLDARGMNPMEPDDDAYTGRELYQALKRYSTEEQLSDRANPRPDEDASSFLHSLDIAGIKYLDASSRAAGDGSYNYVVFDENRVSIRAYEQADGGAPRGNIAFGSRSVITLFQQRDLSTLLHEGGHLWLEELAFDAADPAAGEQITNDLRTVLDWLGVQSVEQIGVDQHEQFARGVEAYFLEGRAPSPALRDVFARFKAWLVSIYHTVAKLDVALTDEVRGVMDRLIATDAEIAQARETQRVTALPADQLGMTEAEHAAYRKTVETADQAAHDALLKKVMHAIRRERTKEWKEERERVREEAARDIDALPDVAALNFLRSGQAKLSKRGLVDLYGSEAVLSLIPRGVPPLVTDSGGIQPEEMAALFGFDSGDALVQALMTLEAESRDLKARDDKRGARAARIDAETDRRMVEKHGDVLNDGTIEQEALDAVNDMHRGAQLTGELRALIRKAGSDQKVWSEDAMKGWAQAQIAGRKARDVRPAVYLRAERKAGDEALKALAKDDTQGALDAKFRQLLNLHLYRAARDASDEMDKAFGLMSRLASKRTLKSMDQDYLDQIHGLLERVDLKPVTGAELERRAAFRVWVAGKQADGEDIDPPTRLMDDAFRQHWSEMSVEEVRGLHDTVRNIAHLGRLKRKLLSAKDARDFDEAVIGLVATIRRNMKARKPAGIAAKPFEKWGAKVSGFFAAHRKTENLLRELDGFEDLGPAWGLIYSGLNEAQDAKSDELARIAREMGELFKVYSPAERVRMGPVGRKVYPQIGQSLSKWQVLSIALNMGNEGNREALADAENSPGLEAYDALLNTTMTEKDWRFVQSVWDYIDRFYPRIAALEREMTGIAPEKVEAVPVKTPFGEFRGGYYPLKYDFDRSWRASMHEVEDRAKRMMSGGFVRPQTRTGAAKERVGSGGQAVRLNIDVLFEHLGDVVHDLTHRKAVVGAYRLANDRRVAGAIRDTAGPTAHKLLLDWIRDIAGGENTRATGLDDAANYLRGGVTVVNMGLKFTTAAVQPFGYTQTVARIGERWALKGIQSFYGNPAKIVEKTAWIMERSPYMASRLRTFDRDIHDMQKKIGPGGGLTDIQNSFFLGIAWMDRGVALPSWIGAYEKSMHEQGDEDLAAEYADSVVRMSQSSGLQKDLANIQRGRGLVRLFTAFYSFFSTTWNMSLDEAKQVGMKGVGYTPRAALNMLWLIVLPSLLSQYVLGRGPEDDEEWWEWAAKELAGYSAGTLVGVRDLVGALTSPFDYSPSPVFDVIKQGVGSGKKAVKGDFDRGFWKGAVIAGGTLAHLPARQAWITGEAIKRDLDGEEVPLSDYFTAPRP